MASGDFSRLIHTARHLRAQQIAYRLYYRLGKPWVARRALAGLGQPSRRRWPAPWSGPRTAARSHFACGEFAFLGERGVVNSAGDWNAKDKSKLWLYNLHYLDDLNAVDADERSAQQAWLIQRWIDDNPPLVGNGWEPYPLSLRLVNLIEWFARPPQSDGTIPGQWLASLARQAQALAAQEERHILANHLFANGKALTFAGAFFAGDCGARWLKRGLEIVDQQSVEQFLNDGGHFELSPMYHATLLWDLCDLLNLAQRSGIGELCERAPAWQKLIENGLSWLADMCHPDGEIAFFNDAALGIAPPLAAIGAYATALGCAHIGRRPRDFTYVHHAASGYITVYLANDGRALLDVAEVGASYQPGHAHADTLSFELSLYGQRVLVNSGTSQYGDDGQRHYQRSTAAHNTVAVDGENSSEVWAGFRVARRAHPAPALIQRTTTDTGDSLLISCSHDGYARLPGAPVHRRQWEFSATGLRIIDTVSGTFRTAVSRFHVHPAVLIDERQTLRLPTGQAVFLSVSGGKPRVVPALWHPGFGVSQPGRCIEIVFDDGQVVVDFRWR